MGHLATPLSLSRLAFSFLSFRSLSSLSACSSSRLAISLARRSSSSTSLRPASISDPDPSESESYVGLYAGRPGRRNMSWIMDEISGELCRPSFGRGCGRGFLRAGAAEEDDEEDEEVEDDRRRAVEGGRPCRSVLVAFGGGRWEVRESDTCTGPDPVFLALMSR